MTAAFVTKTFQSSYKVSLWLGLRVLKASCFTHSAGDTVYVFASRHLNTVCTISKKQSNRQGGPRVVDLSATSSDLSRLGVALPLQIFTYRWIFFSWISSTGLGLTHCTYSSVRFGRNYYRYFQSANASCNVVFGFAPFAGHVSAAA